MFVFNYNPKVRAFKSLRFYKKNKIKLILKEKKYLHNQFMLF